MSNEGYAEFAGKCQPMAEAAVAADPTLRLVRGWYHCPLWGARQHWWAARPDGTIVDPTVTQFPTAGARRGLRGVPGLGRLRRMRQVGHSRGRGVHRRKPHVLLEHLLRPPRGGVLTNLTPAPTGRNVQYVSVHYQVDLRPALIRRDFFCAELLTQPFIGCILSTSAAQTQTENTMSKVTNHRNFNADDFAYLTAKGWTEVSR